MDLAGMLTEKIVLLDEININLQLGKTPYHFVVKAALAHALLAVVQ